MDLAAEAGAMICAKCGTAFNPTESPGANLYGPPLDPTDVPLVNKAHIYPACVPSLEVWLGQSLRTPWA